MVVEPWLIKMGNQVSNNLKNSSILPQKSSKKNCPSSKKEKKCIGILSFEVANVMSKLVHLHKSICDEQISRLVNEIIKLEGVKKLVSCDESYLIELAYDERLDDLNRIAEVVSRLGKKCNTAALQGFEHVYGDLISGKIEVKELGFLVKDMEGMIRKMERYVGATSNLYSELEVLNELEQATMKFPLNQNVESRHAFEQKLVWHRQDVRSLKDVSLWNQGYDKVVEMLARTVCTLYARICFVFGNAGVGLKRSCSRSVVTVSRILVEEDYPGGLVKAKSYKSNGKVEHMSSVRPLNRLKSLPNERTEKSSPNLRTQFGLQKEEVDFAFPRALSPGRIFKECLSFSSPASKIDDEDNCSSFSDQKSYVSGSFSVPNGLKKEQSIHSVCLNNSQIGIPHNASRLGTKSRLATHATPSTIGGSALALHYANVIIVIEKFLCYPHLVGEEARDDLYQMLPNSLRKSLRINLKSHCNNFAIYDGALAHDWKENLDGILKWLSPLAHNMIRWQSEHNVEQQQMVTRTNVLLLQTLYFADRVKTESAMCQLLLGLNFICRYEQQQNALLDCASSFDFGDWMEWQLECQNSCLN